MTRTLASPLFLIAALLTLGACNGSKPAGGGNVSMHDMEVVDGTANDSMVDLDNAAQDGTLLSNAGGLPGAMPMGGGGMSNMAAAPAPVGNASEAPAAGAKEKTGNSSAPE